MLYARYGITEDEAAFIASQVNEMPDGVGAGVHEAEEDDE